MSDQEGHDKPDTAPIDEPAVTLVAVNICDLCLDGEGGECHVPGCAFYLSAAPTHSLYVQSVDSMREENERLRNAILRIDHHAVCLGETQDGWCAVGYYVPMGPLHKAIGVVGHPAASKATELPPDSVVGLLARAIERTDADLSANLRTAEQDRDSYRELYSNGLTEISGLREENERLKSEALTRPLAAYPDLERSVAGLRARVEELKGLIEDQGFALHEGAYVRKDGSDSHYFAEPVDPLRLLICSQRAEERRAR